MEAADALSWQAPRKTEKCGVKRTNKSHRTPSKHKHPTPEYFQMFVLRPDIDIQKRLTFSAPDCTQSYEIDYDKA
jgi:hypothetical protein